MRPTRPESPPETRGRQGSVPSGTQPRPVRPPSTRRFPLGPELPEKLRLDRDTYFAAGYRLLGDRGFEGLTVPALCNRVGATKGSFYHHFEDLPAFVEELAQRWQAWIVGAFTAMAARSDPRERFESAAHLACALVVSGGPAMRAAASTNAAVTAAILTPSRTALAFSSDTFSTCAQDEDSGRVLAAMVASMSIGVEHRARPITREHYLEMIAREWAALGIGAELFRRRGTVRMRITTAGPVATVLTGSEEFAGLSFTGTVAPQRPARDVRQTFLAAAWELLGEGGPQTLTTRALAERVGLGKSSLRHRFGSAPAFEEALAKQWELEHTQWIEHCARESDPRRRLELLLSDLLIRPEQSEVVWRSWGHSNPVVGAALRRRDQLLENAIADTLHRMSPGGPDPGITAEMTLAFCLGLHRWYPVFEPDLAARAAVEWVHRVIGIDAELSHSSGRPALAFSRRSARDSS